MKKNIFFAFLYITLTTQTTQKPLNLTENKKLVESYYESGAFQQETADVLHDAWEKLKNITPQDNTVVIIDIYETALSHYAYFKMMQFAKEESSFIRWKFLGLSPAITPVLHFYNKLIDHGFKVIFISCRSEPLREATRNNLKQVGYDTFEQIILRTPKDKLIPFYAYKKKKRAELAKEGWHIVACVGDQWSDLAGDHTGLRIKIPNYILSE